MEPISSPDPTAVPTERDDTVGLVAALGPELTGRVHLAYRQAPERRWWRRRYPGRLVPEWDFVSLCGRRGLVVPEPPRPADCRACAQILANRHRRLARRTGVA